MKETFDTSDTVGSSSERLNNLIFREKVEIGGIRRAFGSVGYRDERT